MVFSIEYFIKEFIDRSNKNLTFIDENKEYEDVYETTQLINSLFGILILPHEHYKFKKGKKVAVSERKLKSKKGYDGILTIINELKKKRRIYNSYGNKFRVYSFINHLRNALAHSGDGGLYFYPCDKDHHEIESVIFFDSENGKEFCVELDIKCIRSLIEHIGAMYSELANDPNIESAGKKLEEYNDAMNAKRDLFAK